MGKQCRVCRQHKISEFISIHCIASKHQKHISEMLETVVGIKYPMDSDRLPERICNQCYQKLDEAYSIWKRCQSHHLLTRCPEGQEDEYLRCRICTRRDVNELISLHSICDPWKMKVHEMVQFFSNVAVEKSVGLPPYVCEVCLDALDKGVRFKKLCSESAEILRNETSFAWEKMEFESNNHRRLVVDLFAELVHNTASGKLQCSVCELEVGSNQRPDSCGGCLLHFRNKNEVYSCARVQTPSNETANLFDVLENNPNGLFQRVRCKGPVCCSCDEIFLSEDELQKHRNEVHPPVDVRNEYYCESCSSNLESSGQLKLHQKKIKDDVFIYCKKCRKILIYPYRHQLEFHIPEETLKKFRKQTVTTYECCVAQCNSFYDTQKMLQGHISAAHTKNALADDTTCGYCNLSFPSESAFEEHNEHELVQERYFCQIDKCSYTVLKLDRIISHCLEEPHKLVSTNAGRKVKPKRIVPDLKHFTAIGDVDEIIDVLESISEFCCGCSEFFETNLEFSRHCQENHRDTPGEFSCATCKKEFTNESALKTHENKAADRIYYYCRPCKAFLWDIFQVNRHKAYVHTDIAWTDADERYERVTEQSHICCGCDKQFCNEEELAEHRQVRHHIRNASKAGRKCHLCHNVFESSRELQRHLELAESGVVFKCKVADCIFRCKLLSTIKFHVTSKSHRNADGSIYLANANPNQYRCCFLRCEFIAYTYDEIIDHADIEHALSREERKLHPHPYHTIECPVCFKGMRNEMALVIHQQGKVNITCKRCMKSIRREDYDSHLDVCRLKSDIMCEKCSLVLPSQALLRKHMRKKHSEETKSDLSFCTLCGKSYKNKTFLREHIMSHDNSRLWKCSFCTMNFKSYTRFKNHMRVHTNEKKYGCRHGCEKRFKYGGDRDRHEKLVHLGIRPFGCKICSAGFVRDRDLRLHMRKHTGVRLFPCENCDASFDKMSEFREHKETCESTK